MDKNKEIEYRKLKSGDKRNKNKINFQKGNKLTEIKETNSLQKSKYYNIITIDSYQEKVIKVQRRLI